MNLDTPQLLHYLHVMLVSWLLGAVPGVIAQPMVSDPCRDYLGSLAHESNTQSTLDPARIRVFNWNIHKSTEIGWQEDLAQLASAADLVLLQEATLEKTPLEVLSAHEFGIFAPGYSFAGLNSGVMTLSTVRPSSHCALQHREPWLQSPKATAITLYPLTNTQDLLVANLHGINFSLDSSALGEQLSAVAAQIQQHEGPVILAGDFNTWSSARKAELSGITEHLGLYGVSFAEDSRITVFGNTLDHMLVRGLEVLESRTHRVESSDHNPFTVTLRLPVNQEVKELL